jgi:hypothetical protein
LSSEVNRRKLVWSGKMDPEENKISSKLELIQKTNEDMLENTH